METVTDFIFLGSKITADGDRSHEIKRHLLLGSRDVPGERGRLSSCIWNLGFFPNDARKYCPFVLTAFTGGSSERCPGIGFLSRGDREIGVLRNVEPPTRPRLECLRETGLILRPFPVVWEGGWLYNPCSKYLHVVESIPWNSISHDK